MGTQNGGRNLFEWEREKLEKRYKLLRKKIGEPLFYWDNFT